MTANGPCIVCGKMSGNYYSSGSGWLCDQHAPKVSLPENGKDRFAGMNRAERRAMRFKPKAKIVRER